MGQFKSWDDNDGDGRYSTTTLVPFDWEETPGTAKSHLRPTSEMQRSELRRTMDEKQLEKIDPTSEMRWSSDEKQLAKINGFRSKSNLTNELFEGSKIRPLRLPPRLEVVQIDCGSRALSARWKKSPVIISPWHQWPKTNESDPFAKAIQKTISKSLSKGTIEPKGKDVTERKLPKDPPPFKPMPEGRPSSALLPNKVVARDVKFSSFRSVYGEKGHRHRRVATTVGSSLRWPLPEDQLPSRRRPLLHRLGIRTAIHRAFKKVFGST